MPSYHIIIWPVERGGDLLEILQQEKLFEDHLDKNIKKSNGTIKIGLSNFERLDTDESTKLTFVNSSIKGRSDFVK